MPSTLMELTFEGTTRVVRPLDMTYSLKDGHRFVYHDIDTGAFVTIPLAGCSFVEVSPELALTEAVDVDNPQ